MRVRLIPLTSEPNVRAVLVTGPRFVIGRAGDCDLSLESQLVSRHHCELEIEGDLVWVRDLESSNGTYVNDHRISERTGLSNGDILALPAYPYTVEICVPGSGVNLLSRVGHAFAKALH